MSASPENFRQTPLAHRHHDRQRSHAPSPVPMMLDELSTGPTYTRNMALAPASEDSSTLFGPPSSFGMPMGALADNPNESDSDADDDDENESSTEILRTGFKFPRHDNAHTPITRQIYRKKNVDTPISRLKKRESLTLANFLPTRPAKDSLMRKHILQTSREDDGSVDTKTRIQTKNNQRFRGDTSNQSSNKPIFTSLKHRKSIDILEHALQKDVRASKETLEEKNIIHKKGIEEEIVFKRERRRRLKRKLSKDLRPTLDELEERGIVPKGGFAMEQPNLLIHRPLTVKSGLASRSRPEERLTRDQGMLASMAINHAAAKALGPKKAKREITRGTRRIRRRMGWKKGPLKRIKKAYDRFSDDETHGNEQKIPLYDEYDESPAFDALMAQKPMPTPSRDDEGDHDEKKEDIPANHYTPPTSKRRRMNQSTKKKDDEKEFKSETMNPVPGSLRRRLTVDLKNKLQNQLNEQIDDDQLPSKLYQIDGTVKNIANTTGILTIADQKEMSQKLKELRLSHEQTMEELKRSHWKVLVEEKNRYKQWQRESEERERRLRHELKKMRWEKERMDQEKKRLNEARLRNPLKIIESIQKDLDDLSISMANHFDPSVSKNLSASFEKDRAIYDGIGQCMDRLSSFSGNHDKKSQRHETRSSSQNNDGDEESLSTKEDSSDVFHGHVSSSTEKLHDEAIKWKVKYTRLLVRVNRFSDEILQECQKGPGRSTS